MNRRTFLSGSAAAAGMLAARGEALSAVLKQGTARVGAVAKYEG